LYLAVKYAVHVKHEGGKTVSPLGKNSNGKRTKECGSNLKTMDIWVDGSGALLPGQTARIAVVFGHGSTEILEVGRKTNNEAEYLALIHALKTDVATEATIYSDSQLVVNQLTADWEVEKPHLKPLWTAARQLLQKTGAKLVWIPREQNRAGKVLEKVLGREKKNQ
jgi:ribonuclease HI